MTLPAFEAPVAALPVQPPVQPNAFLPPPVQATPVEAPVAASPVAPPAEANPFAEPAQMNPFAQPAQMNPFAQTVHAGFSERSTHVTPSAPPVDVNPVVRPGPGNPSPQAVDVNPVVRPAHASPVAIAQPVVEQSVQASPVAQPVAEEPAVAQPVDASPVAQAVLEQPVHASPVAEEPAVAQALLEQPVHASPVPPPVLEQPVHASALEAPVVEAPVVEAPVQATAFETAPTEFAGSETPIAPAPEAEAKLAQPQTVEAAPSESPSSAVTAAELAPVETPASTSADSVVGEAEIQEQAPRTTLPYPAPRSFTSSGSEMPVVITTPAPYRRDNRAPTARLLDVGRELLPRARKWSKKTLRDNPRALVIGAPLVALLGIWAVRSAVSHPKRGALAEANANAAAQVAPPTPAPQTTAAVNAALPAPESEVPASAAASAAPPSADPAELAGAVTHGLPALEALAQKFPNDPQVLLALAHQQAQAQRFEAAVGTLERVIGVAPQSAQNGKAMGILWRAAQSGASERSFLALRKLGARGADIAFDLATTAGVRDSVRERAKTELGQLSSDASSDTRVASALLLAPDCAARHSLLGRAEREGKKRTLTLLEGYARGSVCSSTSEPTCNSCLTGSPELAHALSQLSAGVAP